MKIVHTGEPATIAKADDSVTIRKTWVYKATRLMVKLAVLRGWDREWAVEVMIEALDDILAEINHELDPKRPGY